MGWAGGQDRSRRYSRRRRAGARAAVQQVQGRGAVLPPSRPSQLLLHELMWRRRARRRASRGLGAHVRGRAEPGAGVACARRASRTGAAGVQARESGQERAEAVTVRDV